MKKPLFLLEENKLLGEMSKVATPVSTIVVLEINPVEEAVEGTLPSLGSSLINTERNVPLRP